MKLYKYLPRKYLDSFVKEGKILFRSLSYFQDYEDDLARGDKYDGVLKHSKDGGLQINNLTSGKSFHVPVVLESKVDSENVFVFCASKKLCPELAKKFKADVCVEVTNSAGVISRLHSAVARRKKIKPNKLFHGEVEYYSEEEAPGITWAFPKQIAMKKLSGYSDQEEYRMLFSLNGALEFGKTNQQLRVADGEKKQRLNPYPEHTLKIGNIGKWCNIHEFT